MKFFYSLILLTSSLFSGDSFITQEEYAEYLYHEPRGIGCQKCHGEKGEGRLIAEYQHKKQNREFRGSSIRSVKYKDFEKSLNKRIKGMPRYFLTKNEIKMLFLYLHPKKVKTDAK
ncbi:MAG: cytochrome c [Helicobacteraceae bacterium]|nr:cytochrome c [Helicobacteraceae bacterium]